MHVTVIRKTAALLLAALHAGAAFGAIDSPVRIDAGRIAGTAAEQPSIRVFRGIPFAAPPVGARRWQAPQPVTHWDDVRQADRFSPSCMQAQDERTPASRPDMRVAFATEARALMSEDCLYLNVWTAAASSAERRAVMVWIHPGGYTSGSVSSPRYDGTALAAQGVVLVTINYRLGPFGFFSHPELTRESQGRWAANQGLMDQVAALQWVARNIAAFGGDPDRVTVFGNSAGAGSIAYLMASPRAQGLFQRAIAQSASWPGLSIEPVQNLAQSEQAGLQLAASLGAPTLAELRALRAEDLVNAKAVTRPVTDGWFMPQDPGKQYAAGRQNDVPLLVGSNRDEGTFFLQPATSADWVARARKRFGDEAGAFLKLYPGADDATATRSQYAAFRDELNWLMRKWAQLQQATGSAPAYLYYFTHEPPGAASWPASMSGVTHGAEEQFVFGNVRGEHEWRASDRATSRTLASYWVNFASNGNPNGPGLPAWQPYDPVRNDRPMLLDEVAHAGPEPVTEQLAFFERWYQRQAQ